MSDDTPAVETRHLPHGVVKFPPNVHGVYVEPREDGRTNLIARQNEAELVFVLERDDCEHLAALLARKDR
jgi:hypothetical protein